MVNCINSQLEDTMIRTFKYPLYPTKNQVVKLNHLLATQCELYNAALEEKIGLYKWNKNSVSCFDQYKTLSQLKEVRPDITQYGTVANRGTLQRLDRAFKSFYRRCKTNQKAGFPRFKSLSRLDSVEYGDKANWKIKEPEKRIKLLGIGDIKVKFTRKLKGLPKNIVIKKVNDKKWYISIVCTDIKPNVLPKTNNEVGIDLGIVNQVTLSNGTLIEGQRLLQKSQDKLTYHSQKLAKCKKGSNRRKKVKQNLSTVHRKIANQRKDFNHKLTRQLVNNFDLIVHEDLNIKNMSKSNKGTVDNPGINRQQKKGLNRSILDAGWSQLLQFMYYKAEEADRTIIAVNPQYTSQKCSQCKYISKQNRTTQNKFKCIQCGYLENADINAANNILEAGRALQDRTDLSVLECVGSN